MLGFSDSFAQLLTFHGLGPEQVMLQPPDTLHIGVALDDFTTVLDNDTAGQLRVLGQHLGGLVAELAANVHKYDIVISTASVVTKRHHIHADVVFDEPHGSLKVLEGIGPLLEPGVDLKLRAMGPLECTAIGLILISCLLEELGQSMVSRAADRVEESNGVLHERIGKDVCLLTSHVLIRCCLSDQATCNHVAHDATDQQWVCHVGTCELCRRQWCFALHKGLKDSKVPANVEERSLSTLLQELRQCVFLMDVSGAAIFWNQTYNVNISHHSIERCLEIFGRLSQRRD